MVRFLDKLNTPKVFIPALVLVVAVNGLLFLVHNYRLAQNTATASPANTVELDTAKSSSAEATTENGKVDNSGNQEQGGAKESAGAVDNPVSKQTDGLKAPETKPQSPSGFDPNTSPSLDQPATYPTPAAPEKPTEPPAIPTTYPQSVYDSNSWSGNPNDDSASPTG